MSLLSIEHLHVQFDLEQPVLAVRDLSLSIDKGETIGLVGESGCGKSVTANAILRILQKPGRISSGHIFFEGNDLTNISTDEIRKVRGRQIAMIFQEPMTSLNPVLTIGKQITETIELHLGKSGHEAHAMAVDLLSQVGIPDPESRVNSYPHELSGGMRQRVMIAMSLSANPAILIADEPTTALDVTIQAQILDLLLSIQKERNMSLLIISHDLGLIGNMADRIAIMYAGEICEIAGGAEIFDHPMHPYTKGLFNAVPRIGTRTKRLTTIPGSVPTIHTEPAGCVYKPRCPIGDDSCTRQKINLEDKGNGHLVRCIKAG